MAVDDLLADIARGQLDAFHCDEARIIERDAVDHQLARLADRPGIRNLLDHRDIVEIDPEGQLLVAAERLDVDDVGGVLEILAIFGEAGDDIGIEEAEHHPRAFEPVARDVAILAAGAEAGIGARGAFAQARAHRNDDVLHRLVPDRIVDPVIIRRAGRREGGKRGIARRACLRVRGGSEGQHGGGGQQGRAER